MGEPGSGSTLAFPQLGSRALSPWCEDQAGGGRQGEALPLPDLQLRAAWASLDTTEQKIPEPRDLVAAQVQGLDGGFVWNQRWPRLQLRTYGSPPPASLSLSADLPAEPRGGRDGPERAPPGKPREHGKSSRREQVLAFRTGTWGRQKVLFRKHTKSLLTGSPLPLETLPAPALSPWCCCPMCVPQCLPSSPLSWGRLYLDGHRQTAGR